MIAAVEYASSIALRPPSARPAASAARRFRTDLKISARDEQGRWASRGGGSRGVGAEEARARRVALATGPDLMREEHAQTSMTARLRQNGRWGIGGGVARGVVSRRPHIQAKFREKRHNRPLNPTNNQDHLAEGPCATNKDVDLLC